jgi:cobalamin biosynthesis protein CobT
MSFTDWFGRKGKNYTSTYKGSTRLGWDTKVSGSYSSFFAPDLNKRKLLRDSYRHACDIRDIMDIPRSIRIQLNVDAETSCTDGKTVIVSTKVYDDNKIDNNVKLDVFLGTTIHEFSHILYTDMAEIRKNRPNKFLFNLFNTIEDERIEYNTTQNYPGYANFIGQAKYYYFDLLYKKAEKQDDLMDVLQNILYIVRYPARVDTKVIYRHQVLFDKIKKVLCDFGNNSKEAYDKAEKIYKLLLDYFKFPPPPPEEQQEGDEEQDQSDSSEGQSDSGEGQEGSDGSSDPQNSKQSSQKQDSKDNEGSDKNSKTQSSPKSGSDEGSAGKKKQEPIKAYTQEEIKQAAEKLAEQMRRLITSNTSLNSNEIKDEWDSKEIADEYKQIKDDVFIVKQEDYERRYKADFDTVKQHINGLVNTFSKFFVEQEYRLTGMRRGVLDTNKLAEAYQAVETVYSNKFKRTTPGLDVCVLIDESGSMSGTNIASARKCAILLNEVFLRLKQCDFYVYGHTADNRHMGEVTINVYRDHWNRNRYALGKVESYSNNKDSVAIEETYKMVRKQTSKPLLMFVISDGAPNAYGLRGQPAVEEVKKVVNRIESNGDTLVCQIAIESHFRPQDMFNHYVVMTNMNTFPSDLSGYVMNTLISKLKRVDV